MECIFFVYMNESIKYNTIQYNKEMLGVCQNNLPYKTYNNLVFQVKNWKIISLEILDLVF